MGALQGFVGSPIQQPQLSNVHLSVEVFLSLSSALCSVPPLPHSLLHVVVLEEQEVQGLARAIRSVMLSHERQAELE